MDRVFNDRPKVKKRQVEKCALDGFAASNAEADKTPASSRKNEYPKKWKVRDFELEKTKQE